MSDCYYQLAPSQEKLNMGSLRRLYNVQYHFFTDSAHKVVPELER